MSSTLNNVFINGRATQSLAAQGPQDLVRLQEAQALLTSLFQNAWNASATYTSGMMVNYGGSLYLANQQTQGQAPGTGSAWRLLVEGGDDAYVYVAYASDANGDNFSLTPAQGLYYVSILASPVEITSPTAGDFSEWMYVGPASYLYIAYASDTSGTGFSTTPGTGLNYIGILNSSTAIGALTAANFTGKWIFIGASGYLYVAYASDASGTDFSTTPGTGLNYIGILNSPTAITTLTAGNFTGLWTNVQGQAGSTGQSVYPYVAYASDASGTNFSLTPGVGLVYSAFLLSTTQISSPNASNFTGLWRLTGPSSYIYIAYASDSNGTNFSTTPSNSLNYIGILNSPTPITSPAAGNFTGLWKLYGAPAVSATAPLTLTSGVIGINATNANTANYVVQRDSSGNFSAGQVSVTSIVVGSSATLSIVSGALNVNLGGVFPSLTVGALNGIVMATAGALGTGATTDNLTQGTTNLYFSQSGVRTTPLTGITSTNVLQATDTVLSAFGKIDNFMGGNFSSATFTGNVSITGSLTVSGQTTLLTSLNGVLKATNGLISGSATSDNIPQGTTNLYMTTAGVQTILTSFIGAANGVCGLTSSSLVAWANLPPLTGFTAAAGTVTSSDTILTAFQKVVGNINAIGTPLSTTLTGFTVLTGTISSTDTILSAIEKLVGNLSNAANAVLTNYASTSGTITSSDTILSGIEKLNGNILVSSTLSTLPGFASTTGTITSSDTVLTALQKTTGNIPAAVAGAAAVATLTGFVAGAGTVTAGDTVLTAIQKIVGNVSGIVSPLTQQLTGFAAGAGTVTSTDTILSAFQKLAGNQANYAQLSGSTFTGNLMFGGYTNSTTPGFIPNQLSSSQIGNLSVSTTYNGAIVYNSTTNQLMALINGNYVALAQSSNLPLTAGSSYPLTGTLYFQDGLATAIKIGSTWSQRTSNSDANFDVLSGSTVVLTCDNSSNVHAPNGYFDTPNGYMLNGSEVLYLSSSAPYLNFGGSFYATTTSSFATLVLGYNGTAGVTIDQNAYCHVVELYIGANKAIDTNSYHYDKNAIQILSTQQSVSLHGGGTTSSGWTDSNAMGDFNALINALRAHGLIVT